MKRFKRNYNKIISKTNSGYLFIGDAISNPTAFSSEFDDDELEAELEALELEAQTDEQVMFTEIFRL